MGLIFINIKKTKFSFSVVFALSFLFSSSLKGQTEDPQNQKWESEIRWNNSGRLITGTFNQFVFSSHLETVFTSAKWNIENSLTYRYNQTNNHPIENNWYELLVVSYFLKSQRLFPTVFYHYDNNLMFRVNSRHSTGGVKCPPKFGPLL